MVESWQKHEARKILAVLLEAHPGVFFPKDSEATRPLKVGIADEIIAAHPELKPNAIRRFLGIYCDKQRYLTALVKRRPRCDLLGNDIEPPSNAQVARAQSLLDRRARDRAKVAAAQAIEPQAVTA